MIITITLNPAIDKTVTVDTLRPGELNRVRSVREDAGGKGINVSKTIRSLGGESIAVGMSGGESGRMLMRMIEPLGIEHRFIELGGRTRTNLKVADAHGEVTEINEPGPTVSLEERQTFENLLCETVKPGDFVVISGSVPAGVPEDYYAFLIRKIRGLGGNVFLDADGVLFANGVEEIPDAVKPNLAELRTYFTRGSGRSDADDKADRIRAFEERADSAYYAASTINRDIPVEVREALFMGRLLRKKGIPEVIVSLGGQGALFLTAEGDFYAPALPVSVRSTVGAGDAMTAAYAYAKTCGMSVSERISLSVAAAAGAVMTDGTAPADRDTVAALKKQVEVRKITSGM